MTKKIVLALTLTVILTSSLAFAQQPARTIAAGERYNATGDRIIELFDVHGAELRSVLRQLSAYGRVDIVPSDATKAMVSLSVTNKSWREILAIICMVHNLSFLEEHNFIYVMTAQEAAVRGIGSAGAVPGVGPLTPAPSAEDLGPLTREVIPMRFTTAEEMSEAITPFLTARGKLTAIRHTNALIIVDTDENLRQLKGLIGQIDIQTAQVSISCKIIEVSSGTAQNIGINWGFTDVNNNVTVGQFWDPEVAVPFPGGNTRHTVTYGLLTPERFGLTLEYLLEDSRTEIVAQPQITTLNNKEARIFMGQQVPINTRDEAGNIVTQMVNAGTQLTVTPYVSGDGSKIMLSLSPSKESYSLHPTDGTPIINQQSATTNVLVSNGETVVIAGLTSNEKQNIETGIPVLKNIPILGNLFKRSVKTTGKRDLVIFVTPHIIHSGM
jgi:type IV pilus secretin PilQ/predicted competence protein